MKIDFKKILSNTWMYALLLVVMVITISMKIDYHMDEVFSYGLANNVGQTSIHPYYAPFTYENTPDIFLDYMVIEEGEGFSISNCWYNQERESSPPLYYFAVHIMSVFAGERFSRWTAGSINLVFMFLTLYVFRKILELFGVKGKELVFFTLFFIFSPALLSIASFFRMYAMAVFAATTITYLILKYRNHENWKFYMGMILISVFSALTQYFLIFYLFFISLFYGITLLYKKEWIKAIKYIVSMGIAGGLSYLIFPAIIQQLFGEGRGSQGIDSFFAGFETYGEYLAEYVKIINKQLFGNLLGTLVLLGVIFGISMLITRKKIDLDKAETLCITFLPTICYVLLVAKVAPYTTDRYVMAVYAMITIALLLGVRHIVHVWFKEKIWIKRGCLCAVCLIVLLSVWKDFKWPYLFLSQKEFLETMDTYSDVDGLCLTDAGWRISGNFIEMIKLNSMTFFQGDVSILGGMEELRNKSEFILYVVDYDPQKVINQIYEICPNVNSAEWIGHSDASEIFHIYSSK